MSLFMIAWRSIQQRGLASALTMFSMALGVTLVVAVLSIHGIVADAFSRNSTLGYNLIVGARGGRLQLVLNSVFYLSRPIENIPYDYYLQFQSEAERARHKEIAENPRPDLDQPGDFSPFVELAIPICLGDYYGRFLVVGTTTDMFGKLVYDPANDRTFEFARGRNFKYWDEENGFFEAVVGATVADEMEVEIGQRIQFTHGDPEGSGHGSAFTVVGILQPTGMSTDRAVFVNIEGFYLMEGHAKPVKKKATESAEVETDRNSADHAGDPSSAASVDHVDESADVPPVLETTSGEHDGHEEQSTHGEHGAEPSSAGPSRDPLPLEQREVTAVLIKNADPIFAVGMENTINEAQVAQAVAPIGEITRLFENIVGPIQSLLLLLTGMICLVSGISILVSIYNSMNDRRRDIAVMRALGANRTTVMTVILFESVLLSLAGGVIGWVAGHGLNWIASGAIRQRTGVEIGFFDMVLAEAFLIPSLVILAVFVGLLPAIAAYRTDVSKSLSA